MDEETKSSEEQVSKKETTSTEAKPEEKVEPKEQPFNEEQEARIQQMLAQTSATAKEQGKREMQGIKDREVAEAQRRAKLAEGESAGYKSSFDNLDDESKKEAELHILRGQGKQYQTFMQEESNKRQAESYRQTLQDSLVEHVKTLGINPDDKRIDWAEDEKDFLAGRSKFDASVAKILKEKQGEAEKKMKDDFKSLETNLRKELNLDSVDTSTPAGGSDSDTEFMGKFGSGELPMTKANVDRCNKIKEKYK